MKLPQIALLLLLCSITSFAQTKINAGNWNNPTVWQNNNIADNINENAIITTNSNSTITSTDNIVVGNISFDQNNDLTIAAGGKLTLGDLGNLKNLTTSNNTHIYVYGTLTIYGNLIATSNIDIKLYGSGKLIIKGNANFNSNTNIEINDNSLLEINGNFNGSPNNNVNINGNGNAIVKGDLTVGCGSNLNGPTAVFVLYGECEVTGNCNSNFCNSNPLPIELMYFKASKYIEGTGAYLEWATAIEKNFDMFILQRSIDGGKTFQDIATIKGNGNSNNVNKYSYVDMQVADKNYYRLKQIDFDLFTEYSNVVLFLQNDAQFYNVYPNPNNGKELQIFSNYVFGEFEKLNIYDQRGIIVASYKLSNVIPINLVTGFYYIEIINETSKNRFKLIVN